MAPIYGYQCESCNTKKEIIMSMKEHDDVSIECECGSEYAMKEEIYPLKFKLKGYGWYASELTQGIDPNAISDSEIARNNDEMSRVEERHNDMLAKGGYDE